MPSQGRLGDKGQVPADAHGCPACPHPALGPAIQGSPNVNVNGRPALRVQDIGMHAACCGPNMWTATKGSSTVNINGKAAHRMGDQQNHCGGSGQLIEGSPNVIVGDSSSGGAGSAANGQSPKADPTSGGPANPGGPGAAGTGSSAGSGGSGGASDSATPSSNPASPAAPADKKPDGPPAKAPVHWEVRYDDGTVVKGFRSHFKAQSESDEQKLMANDSASHTFGQYATNEGYHVEIHGTTKVKGTVKSPDGNPVVGAKVRIERAFGDPIETTTDGSGNFQADGFLGEEDHEVIVTEPLRSIDGQVKDHEGNPVEGATVTVERAYGEPIELTTDAGGHYHAEGFVEDEPHEVAVSLKGKPAELVLLDEQGKPVAGATLLAQPDSGTVARYTTDENGKVKIEGFTDDPWYRLAITEVTGVAEGTFLDEKGEPKAGVQARVIRSSGPPIDVTSDGSGQYRAEGLIPGEDYVLEIVNYF